VLALLSRCVERLRREREASGQGERFEKLKAFLSGDGAPAGYAAVAAELGLSESAVRVAAHRLRQRFGALLREEVLQSVGDPREVDAEIRWMLEVVREAGAQWPLR
jgi:RNA polymerase sigma-70 factor (ECF subfamily)